VTTATPVAKRAQACRKASAAVFVSGGVIRSDCKSHDRGQNKGAGNPAGIGSDVSPST
jgi:hypothetical protein